MATWEIFSAEAAELAAFGAERLSAGVAYLATVREDGSPRVHPVTPIVGHGRLFLFMEPTSPKGRDLRRDGRYSLHCAVADSSGGAGEFYLRGRAVPVDDREIRGLAVEAASYAPADRYVLFELGIDGAASTVYRDGGPQRRRWGMW
ncbi:MAG: pyridoxamine 5'-phosphate oxidase family protein [Dehalococcoidia bacterium]